MSEEIKSKGTITKKFIHILVLFASCFLICLPFSTDPTLWRHFPHGISFITGIIFSGAYHIDEYVCDAIWLIYLVFVIALFSIKNISIYRYVLAVFAAIVLLNSIGCQMYLNF